MRNDNSPLSAGQPAPDFALPTTSDEAFALSDLRGGPVILAFYPADWSPICGDQMTLYQAVSDEFARYDAIPLGISVDGVWSHRAFAEQHGIHFPLLSDFQPKGGVAEQYGVYDEHDGVDERALYVNDPDGMVFWSQLSPRGVNPGADGILMALNALSAQRGDDRPTQPLLTTQSQPDMNQRAVLRRQANQPAQGRADDQPTQARGANQPAQGRGADQPAQGRGADQPAQGGQATTSTGTSPQGKTATRKAR
jgi:peroxiredoxin